MARCGCAGSSGCSCVVTGGTGTQVYGSGTAADPYVVDATGNTITGTVGVQDTPSVDMSMSGSGTVADPYLISADVALALEDLSDIPAGDPASGDTILWDGSGWVYGPPASGGSGNPIVTDNGVGGTGVLGDPAVARTSGVWGTAPLDVYGADTLNGAPVYVDANGELRAQPGSVSILSAGATRPTQWRGRVIIQAGVAYYSDGSNWLPLQIDLAYAWADTGVSDLQSQDSGMRVYVDSDGKLRSPLGVYLYPGPNPEVDLDHSSSSIYRNAGSIAVGAMDDSTYRYMVLARQNDSYPDRYGESKMYHTFNYGVGAWAVKVISTSQRSDEADENTNACYAYIRQDGQIYTRSDIAVAGTFVTRDQPFAQTQGSATLTGAADETRTVVVTYPVDLFLENPRVFIQPVTGTISPSTTNTQTWVNNSSKTSCQLNVSRSNNTSVTVWWFAIQSNNTTFPTGPGSSASPAPPDTFAAASMAAVAAADEPDNGPVGTGVATCHTDGCGNAGIGIEVVTSWTDEEGGVHDNTNFQCGVCGLPITDITRES